MKLSMRNVGSLGMTKTWEKMEKEVDGVGERSERWGLVYGFPLLEHHYSS